MTEFDKNHSILFEIREHVMYITINLPQTRNMLDWRDSFELAGAYAVANSMDDLRAIVVTGTGDAFHLGGLRHCHDSEYEKERFKDQLRIRNKLMSEFKVPLISVVNGECSGGGMSLLLKSDIAIAAKSAKFGYPEILHNGFPVNSMVNTMNVLPKKLALKCFYFGDLFSADEALRYGLVNMVVPDEDLMEEAEKLVRNIVSKPAELIRIGRKGYRQMEQLNTQAERREYGMHMLDEIMAAQNRVNHEQI